jgi:hypothetical protein
VNFARPRTLGIQILRQTKRIKRSGRYFLVAIIAIWAAAFLLT